MNDGHGRDRPLSFHWKLLDLSLFDGLLLPTPRSRAHIEARASILTEAIIVGRAEPNRWISYSRREAFYTELRRYHGTAYTFATVPPAIDQLAAEGLLEHDRMPPGSFGWQSRFRASPALMKMFDRPMPVFFDPIEIVRLKDKHGHLVDYRDTAETVRMRRELTIINKALRATDIELSPPGMIADPDVFRCDDQVFYRDKKQLWRVFNRLRFTLGGRFYGAWWQTANRRDRGHIKIDGELTIEHDYAQLHPRLIHDLAGKRLIDDAYTIDGWDRSLVKKAFNILLNAETYSAALRAVANEIGGIGAQAKATALIGAVKARHYAIADYFHSGVGLRLQRHDADLAERVMLKLLAEGIVVLPIHDSFIGQSRHDNQIKVVMDEEIFSAFPSLRTTSYSKNLPHMAGTEAGVGSLVLPTLLQGDLFPSLVSVPVSDLSWRSGPMPPSLRNAVRHELRRRALCQNDLALRIGVSRSHLTNALCGRFGLGTSAAERLKAFVVEAAI